MSLSAGVHESGARLLWWRLRAHRDPASAPRGPAHWLTPGEFLDGVAISNLTPGPIAVLATFAGYKLQGVAGAMAATVGLLMPALVLMTLFSAMYGRLQNSRRLHDFMAGVSPAVVGLVASAALLLWRSGMPSWRALVAHARRAGPAGALPVAPGIRAGAGRRLGDARVGTLSSGVRVLRPPSRLCNNLRWAVRWHCWLDLYPSGWLPSSCNFAVRMRPESAITDRLQLKFPPSAKGPDVTDTPRDADVDTSLMIGAAGGDLRPSKSSSAATRRSLGPGLALPLDSSEALTSFRNIPEDLQGPSRYRPTADSVPI